MYQLQKIKMNQYGNTFGVHTPKRSEEYFNRITKDTNLNWTGSSWHNDTCDSMQYTVKETETIHEFIHIYFPNATVDNSDKEEFNTFSITNEKQEELLLTEHIEEVIKFIKSNILIKSNE